MMCSICNYLSAVAGFLKSSINLKWSWERLNFYLTTTSSLVSKKTRKKEILTKAKFKSSCDSSRNISEPLQWKRQKLEDCWQNFLLPPSFHSRTTNSLPSSPNSWCQYVESKSFGFFYSQFDVGSSQDTKEMILTRKQEMGEQFRLVVTHVETACTFYAYREVSIFSYRSLRKYF